jgi:hypothetical protein
LVVPFVFIVTGVVMQGAQESLPDPRGSAGGRLKAPFGFRCPARHGSLRRDVKIAGAVRLTPLAVVMGSAVEVCGGLGWVDAVLPQYVCGQLRVRPFGWAAIACGSAVLATGLAKFAEVVHAGHANAVLCHDLIVHSLLQ